MDVFLFHRGTISICYLSILQMCWAPILVVGFFVIQGILKHGSLSLSLDEARTHFFSTISVNWVYWTVMQALNFKLVPEQLNVLFINIAGIFWTVYLSFVANAVEWTLLSTTLPLSYTSHSLSTSISRGLPIVCWDPLSISRTSFSLSLYL